MQVRLSAILAKFKYHSSAIIYFIIHEIAKGKKQLRLYKAYITRNVKVFKRSQAYLVSFLRIYKKISRIIIIFYLYLGETCKVRESSSEY